MDKKGSYSVKQFGQQSGLKVDAGHWFGIEEGRCRGGVLLAHGLNMDPQSWREMIAFLNRLDFSVYRLELKGHRGLTFEDMLDVSAKQWLDQFCSAIDFMIAHLPGVPLHLVGYSLGGLLGIAAQLQRRESCFERQVLLAPALALKLYTWLAIPLTRVVPFLISRSPNGYVANTRGASSAAYRALFDLKHDIRYAVNEEISLVNLPTLVLMRPSDELISYRGIKKLIQCRKLDKWQLADLPKKKRTYGKISFQHLIVDEKSVGELAWRQMTTQVEHFLTRSDGQDEADV